MIYRFKDHGKQPAIENVAGTACSGHNPMPWLSIKCMFNGKAHYITDDNGHFQVDDQTFLILNHGQPYTIYKNSKTPVETFYLSFPPDWVKDMLHNATSSTEELLDNPLSKKTDDVCFFEKCYPHDLKISPLLQSVRKATQNNTASSEWLEETFHAILQNMLKIQHNIYMKIEQMPYVRRATRFEIYRRLHRARDYMHAHISDPLSLERIAQIAHLSPHYFLRAFKSHFGQTPHAYLTTQRLETARNLLAQTDQSITDICFNVGFESIPSFTNLFRHRFGHPPRKYRYLAVSNQKGNFR